MRDESSGHSTRDPLVESPVVDVSELTGRLAAREFVHPTLGDEIRAIGGGYTYLKEVLLPVGDRSLLYLLGAAYVDTSCCGVGGCGFALVPGFLVEPTRGECEGEGPKVSLVEPVPDEVLRREITRIIQEKEMVQEVRFWSTKEEVP